MPVAIITMVTGLHAREGGMLIINLLAIYTYTVNLSIERHIGDNINSAALSFVERLS